MPTGPLSPTIRILIADDTAEFRKSVRMMLSLERELEIVAVARDGVEALELAHKLQPDLAIFDINMPRMDGLTAIRNVAKVSPNTVCMIMSSESERDQLRQAIAAGVREYLIKPFTVERVHLGGERGLRAGDGYGGRKPRPRRSPRSSARSIWCSLR
jgi:pilus assembly protein CpaE